MKECVLKFEPVTVDGVYIPKWNIYYYDEKSNLELVENYSCNGIVLNDEIRKGYKLIY